jgi:uncharacterized protein (TIGR03118 family)
VRNKFSFYLACFFLLAFLFEAVASAQTVAFRQTKLASNLPNVANNVIPPLVNPWGIAFLPGNPFFVADNKDGRVTSLDATGSGASPGGFAVVNAAGTGSDNPTGIIADGNSFFAGPFLIKPFILVTDRGTVLSWGPDAHGDLPQSATLQVDHGSTGAAYKSVAILNSSLTAPALAVTDFHGGFIETFLPGFSPVALPGSFLDPNLPAGYAPFGIQVIGNQVFVSYAAQDSAKHDPVSGAGNGIVNVFDMDGNLVRRFATGGSLNIPLAITQASANFGPFSNDILIGNTGDGKINAFDPASGNLMGTLSDGDGNDLVEIGLHGLTFRLDGFGDPNALYFTSQVANDQSGQFGAITSGLRSSTKISVPATPTEAPATFAIEVSAATEISGRPTGIVTIRDGNAILGNPALNHGAATFIATLTGVGTHTISANYEGDVTFLPSSIQIQVQVTGLATTLSLTAPSAAAPGSSLNLSATVSSSDGIATGQIVFHDGNTSLGTAPLNDTGVATLRIAAPSIGVHSLTASYSGDDKFSGATSATVTLTVANPDFSLSSAPPSALVVAGQSTQFILTVTPAGGFANDVSLSCSPVVGITCTFDSPTVTTTHGATTATVTVAASAAVNRYGFLFLDLLRLSGLFLSVSMFVFLMRRDGKFKNVRSTFLTALTAVAVLAFSLAALGCGGYGSNTQSNRGTASIVVTAKSGAISRATTLKVTVQ